MILQLSFVPIFTISVDSFSTVSWSNVSLSAPSKLSDLFNQEGVTHFWWLIYVINFVISLPFPTRIRATWAVCVLNCICSYILSLVSVSILEEFVMLTVSMSRWVVCLIWLGLCILGFVVIMTRSGLCTKQKFAHIFDQFNVWLWKLIRSVTWLIIWLMFYIELRLPIPGLGLGPVFNKMIRWTTVMVGTWISAHCLNVWVYCYICERLLAKINGPNFLLELQVNCFLEIIVETVATLLP